MIAEIRSKMNDLLTLAHTDTKEVVDHLPKLPEYEMEKGMEMLSVVLQIDVGRIRNLLGDDAVKLLLGFCMSSDLDGWVLVLFKTICTHIIDPLADKTEKMMTILKNMEALKK